MQRNVTIVPILALTFVCASAASGEPIRVGEEVVLLTHGPGKGLQRTPDVAFGKGMYLAVWQEGWEGEGGSARIFATRVSPGGEVLDPQGIEIAPHKTGVQTRPRLAFGGDVFLVAWQDMPNGKDYDVLAVRVLPTGRVLDGTPITIAGGPRTQALPDVASDGKNFVVVWQGVVEEEESLTFYSFARRVSTTGELGESEQLLEWPNPRIAWNGSSYLVAFSQLRGALLDAAGKRTDEGRYGVQIVRTAGVRFRHFSLASAERGWLVVHDRSQPDYWGWGGPGAMMCVFVEPEGKVAADYEEYLANLPGNERNTPKYQLYDHWLDGSIRGQETWPHGHNACAWDGKQFVAVWERHHLHKKVMFVNCDLLASRVRRWRPADRPAVAVATSDLEEKRPALASDREGGLLCVYESYGADGRVLVKGRTLDTR